MKSKYEINTEYILSIYSCKKSETHNKAKKQFFKVDCFYINIRDKLKKILKDTGLENATTRLFAEKKQIGDDKRRKHLKKLVCRFYKLMLKQANKICKEITFY